MLSDFFYSVVETTVKHTEVEKEKILSPSKNQEVVDARCIIIYILNKEGYYSSQIAKFLNLTETGVRYSLSTIESRFKNNKILKRLLLDIQNEIASK